ncbi:MAG TPA: hypothetical protein VLT62_30530 [Candidatus Methylomirabilis sp.]|nr:hypothetical protein [Candidatus Methylomirabilis sp.]
MVHAGRDIGRAAIEREAVSVPVRFTSHRRRPPSRSGTENVVDSAVGCRLDSRRCSFRDSHPQLEKAAGLFRSAAGKKPAKRIKIAQEIWKIMVDEQYGIGRVGQSPAATGVRVVSQRPGNIPSRQVSAQHARTACSSHPTTFSFKP